MKWIDDAEKVKKTNRIRAFLPRVRAGSGQNAAGSRYETLPENTISYSCPAFYELKTLLCSTKTAASVQFSDPGTENQPKSTMDSLKLKYLKEPGDITGQ